MLGLRFVFLISYVPYHISQTWFYSSIKLEKSVVDFVEEMVGEVTFRLTKEILKLFFAINPCLNPVALCCTSLAFRRQIKRYLSCCCKAKSTPTAIELEG